MKSSILIFYTLALFSACSGKGQSGSSQVSLFNKARQAYWRTDHREAFSAFEKVWEEEIGTSKERAEAGRHLAKMEWRFYNRPEKAHQLLDRLEALGEDIHKARILRARVLASQGNIEEAIAQAKKAVDEAGSETETYGAVMASCRHILSGAERDILNTGELSESSQKLLTTTYKQLNNWMNLKLGDVQVAALNLAFALLLEDGTGAFEAWMAYYRIREKEEVHPRLLTDVDRFEKALNEYAGSNLTEKVSVVVVKGLAESGFYNLAALIKIRYLGKAAHSDQRINEIMAYRDYQLGIAALAERYYRELIQGRTGYAAFNNDINDLGRKLWSKLHWQAEPPAFSTKKFRSEIRKRFKGYLARFSSGGHYGVHLGQVVLDDTRTIRQYNEKADFRYYVLDHMVSNGYTSWFGDGDNEVGGWAPGNGSFLQVRTTMATAPVQMWQKLTDPKERTEVDRNIEEWTTQDEVLARENTYAFLQGLKWRLMARELDAILDSLKTAGHSGPQLRFAFISRIEHIMEGSAIYAHEGRHVIDQQNAYSTVSAELEYTAKLSEIYFSEKPFLSIQNILRANIGSNTPHGLANLRLIKGLVGWMEANADEIDNFDRDRPVLPQLDKLSESQLKAAVKSMDPMAER